MDSVSGLEKSFSTWNSPSAASQFVHLFFFYLVRKYAAQVNKSRVFLFFSVFYFVFIFVAICFGFFFVFFFLFGVFELEMVPISVSRSRSAVFTCHRPPKIDLSEVLLGFTGFYRVLPGFH